MVKRYQVCVGELIMLALTDGGIRAGGYYIKLLLQGRIMGLLNKEVCMPSRPHGYQTAKALSNMHGVVI